MSGSEESSDGRCVVIPLAGVMLGISCIALFFCVMTLPGGGCSCAGWMMALGSEA